MTRTRRVACFAAVSILATLVAVVLQLAATWQTILAGLVAIVSSEAARSIAHKRAGALAWWDLVGLVLGPAGVVLALLLAGRTARERVPPPDRI